MWFEGDPSEYQQALLAWFGDNQADLPWRHDRSPYRVWLSEIMLQQTQVATVIPYFERFLEQFPTVQALANADINEVLKLWEGLGYYSRAQNLHKAAQMVVHEFSGTFPKTVKELKQLPGIGDYTAGAIASFAFEQDAAVVDGNVIRTLTRWFDIAEDVTQSATKRGLWQLAEHLVPARKAAAWNEALMDLGRIVCTPTAPNCEACPMVTLCAANELGIQEERPVKKPAKKKPHYDYAAAVIQDQKGRFLLAQRPFDGLLGGLWEFPSGRCAPGASQQETLLRVVEEKLSLIVEPVSQLATVKHSFTHYKMTKHAYLCHFVDNNNPLESEYYEDIVWLLPDEFEQVALPVTDQKISKVLAGGGQLSLDINS